jgi:hypothetical protein
VVGAVSAEINFEPAPGEPPISEGGAVSLLMPATHMVFYTEQELTTGREEFYEMVFNTLDDQYEGIGAHLRFVLASAHEAAAQMRDEPPG